MAKEIAKLEGKKRELPIGQIKEVLRYALIVMGKYNNGDIIRTVQRYRK